MKLIITNQRIAATADDTYSGPDSFITAPDDFDVSRINDYRYIDNQLTLPAPTVISMRQCRLALLSAGYLAQVESALSALPSPQKEAALIEWEYATEVQREHPMILAIGQAIGLTDAQLDDLFVAGSLL
jgi:hypothetical protein